ncbi:MAG: FAD-binding oxidoreductase [SAR324 cluster bacterium]|nr:FAD-binding oxidoreductase [SAR324 cluster bacterium]
MSGMERAEIVICGAGIAGICTAYHLTVKHGLRDVLIVDPEPPLSVTSDKSYEGYRNWWPGPDEAMVSLTNRSIDLLEALHREQPERLPMNRHGYAFVSADPARQVEMLAGAQESCELGAGELRIHESGSGTSRYTPHTAHGVFDAPTGADVLLGREQIQQHFPHLTDSAIVLLHPRRCGWFSARQFGMFLLEEARERGARLLCGKVVGAATSGGDVSGVQVETESGELRVDAATVINCAGPGQKEIARHLGCDLPVHHDLHMKVAFDDPQGVVPRNMPLSVWLDPVSFEWSAEERQLLAEDENLRWLLGDFPGDVICRPEGGGASSSIIGQWNYQTQPPEPVFPIPDDPTFPEYVLRGLARMIPGMEAYLERIPKGFVDGGYYIKTPENRPLAGPMPGVAGAYILGGLGGSGMQISPAAGELLADQIVGAPLPSYASAFRVGRFDDPDYQTLMEQWGASGQVG